MEDLSVSRKEPLHHPTGSVIVPPMSHLSMKSEEERARMREEERGRLREEERERERGRLLEEDRERERARLKPDEDDEREERPIQTDRSSPLDNVRRD